MTVPGIGPIAATAIAALAPPAETFPEGRDFAAWLGLTPLATIDRRQAEAWGDISNMGERTLTPPADHRQPAPSCARRSKRGAPRDRGSLQMLARKPRMLVIVALANKIARIVWALLAKAGKSTELRSQPSVSPIADARLSQV